MDNLTINNDPEMPREQILPHKIFYFYSTEEIVFKNSVFQNNQNSVILDYYNNEVPETFITLENITVLNNRAIFDDADSPYSSLFIFYCPMEPINILFQNSYFYNNTICNVQFLCFNLTPFQ